MTTFTNNTPINSPITPGTDNRNTWATHYAKYGAGGFEIVANDAERNLISTDRLANKMIFNLETNKFNHYSQSAWVETTVDNVPPEVIADIKANSGEINRLKTHIGNNPDGIYSYRGKVAPTYPATAKEGYYISMYALQANPTRLNLPSGSLVSDTIFCLDNTDTNDTILLTAATGFNIGDLQASTINVPAGNMVFLVLDVQSGADDNWVLAFSGAIPNSLDGISSYIKTKLGGSLHTIAEIEAVLKDRLHTFNEIQKEFSNQLHTITELELNGFEKDTYEYGFVDNNVVPSDSSWLINQARIAEPTNIPAQNKGNKHLALAIPIIVEPLIEKLKVNDIDTVYISEYYTGGTIPRKILITNSPVDTSAIVKVEFQIGVNDVDINKLWDKGIQTNMVKYGFAKTYATALSDFDLKGDANIDETTNITAPAGSPILVLRVPRTLSLTIDTIEVGSTLQVGADSVEVNFGDKDYIFWKFSQPMTTDVSTTLHFNLYDKFPKSSDGGIGLKGDESTEVFIGITDLEMPNSIVESPQGESTTAIIKPYVKTTFPIDDEENPNANQEFKATAMQFLKPLKGFSDPNEQTGVVVEIDHNAYEEKHNSGMLTYLSYSEQLLGSHDDNLRYRKGAIWFDDIIINADGVGIVKDASKKSYGIQEYDGKDPNVTGGTDFLIAFRASFKGQAQNGGFIRLMLINSNATPVDTVADTYITNKDGGLMASERYYQQGEYLEDMEVLGIVTAKQLEEFKCVIITNITGGDIYLNDKEDGISGLMIQSLSSTEKTGQALVQYELDTKQDINFIQLYLGADRATFSYALTDDVAFKTMPINSYTDELNGWGYYAVAQNGFSIQNHYVEIDNDFNIHHIFNADETRALRGKLIKVTTELTNVQVGYTVALVKHIGTPNKYDPDIFKTRNQFAPVMESTWEIVDRNIINMTSSDTFHINIHNFTVPMDAVNYAIVIYPESDFGSAEIKLKELKVDVLNPFNAYYLHSTSKLNETHLTLDKEYAQFSQDQEDYYSLRYTLKNSPTAMPVGILKSGKAEITIDPTINVVQGSSATGGEGALKFERDGIVTINSQFRVFNEKKTAYNTQFWWSKVSDDGQVFTKIQDSDITALINPTATGTATTGLKAIPVIMKMPEFSLEVKAGERLALFGQSDVLDGAYIISYSHDKPLVDTKINYKEIVATSDVPNTGEILDTDLNPDHFSTNETTGEVSLTDEIIGLDLSSFDRKSAHQIVGIKDFTNSSSVTIPLDVPVGVTVAVLSVHRKTGDSIRPIDGIDYSYNSTSKQFNFTLGGVYTGQIILGFYKN
ncbi:hypothetical protein M1M25_gp090 [Tenacibaculum phage Gundel_1]|uniref:Uncharacterized protein n=1 Tax=Tenacibaculum phage Gundel_1 TaxID=2745672 RepID=A0A8E4ZDJ6_9CAUD|nr:hypothetical protein M1M25_gp090 [Tenacibaculum phage Gundel_1]QQV91528.1 hypothetical protein Gundel1_90 [Tenacibaculum phage Gundel_1]